jgi:hypothetical protein
MLLFGYAECRSDERHGASKCSFDCSKAFTGVTYCSTTVNYDRKMFMKPAAEVSLVDNNGSRLKTFRDKVFLKKSSFKA